ncbi:hypothetical protein IP88_01885 [alpha proteobacterium AAP81b]|nr:hypothetical protein IP88_01885 [alpha proteobacterium AAP81b]
MAEADRTEAPTPRRRQQAREQGDVWQPRELGPAAALAVAALALPLAGVTLWQQLAGFLALALGVAGEAALAPPSLAALARAVPVAFPAALAVAVGVAAAALALATSRRVSLAALTPKLSRLDPVKGLQRIVSPSGALGAATALFKLGAVGALTAGVVAPLLPVLAAADTPAAVGAALVRLAGAAALLLAAIAVIDAGVTFVIRENRLKMTRDEIKRESRQNDGAPEIKAAIRRAQFAAASRRLRTGLKDAAVVVVNPLHFAVALRYRAGSDAAPVVVEKGRLDIAAAIVAVARELGVPVIRSPRLARALFFTARIGAPVREELFAAVATILAFVMRFDDAEHEAPPPVVVPPDFDFDAAGGRRKPGAALPL